MTNDKHVKISTAKSRGAWWWTSKKILWSEFVSELNTPVRGVESYSEYITLPKDTQDALKDVGGFVGGWFEGGIRKTKNLITRSLVTLDLDNIPVGGLMDAVAKVRSLEYMYCMYSTRKHSDMSPRLRVIFPLDRECTPVEYEPLCRKLGDLVGINWCDPTTFQAARLMYFPSVCSDGQYFFVTGDGQGFCPVDGLLATYKDWNDVSEWAVPMGSPAVVVRSVDSRQSNPKEKKGVVGAFCRAYTVHDVINEFLSDKYMPVDDGRSDDSRYTYIGGSTTGGAIVFDDGDFLYSYHATDPAGGGLRNAFDLVRLHKFGDLDTDFDSKFKNVSHSSPSNVAMRKFAEELPCVVEELATMKKEELSRDLDAEAIKFIDGIAVDKKGKIVKEAWNIEYLIREDPEFKGKFYLDDFASEYVVCGALPWDANTTIREWEDNDDNGLLSYLEGKYHFYTERKTLKALNSVMNQCKINPVTEYLDALTWDGIPRLETLFIDFLGSDDSIYTRAITRKSLVAAVARIKDPGCFYPTIVVITGKQGQGKSTLFYKLGKDWFSDSVYTLDGKEGAELIQNSWIIEIGEIGNYKNTDLATLKTFLSRRRDEYRPAYGRLKVKKPRKCVMFGTTNEMDYLRDPTGGRRFWPINTEAVKPKLSVFNDLDSAYVDQIWAEAVEVYNKGEDLYLLPELEAEAERRRVPHFEVDPLEHKIREYLDTNIPLNWHEMSDTEQKAYHYNEVKDEITTFRDRVHVSEIWEICLGEIRLITQSDSRRINNVMRRFKDWKDNDYLLFGKDKHRRRGFKKTL